MVINIYRLAHFLHEKGVPWLPWFLKVVIRIVFTMALPPSVKLGKNVTLGYQGLGIVIHARAVIGDNVVVGPNVTIGGRSGHHAVPVIGNDVVIGAGACILGPVVVGDHASIGANAVVLQDVPSYATVVGIPARIVRSDASPFKADSERDGN